MYNCQGWIVLRISPNSIKDIEICSQEYDDLEDEFIRKFIEKVLKELKRISSENHFIKYELISFNNMSDFLTIQYSRNHKSDVIIKFFEFVANLGNGSHGLLYETNDEDIDFQNEKPYKLYRLLGSKFEEIEEKIFNGNLNGLEYL
ncbi:Imm7 family immunity protein [Flavobacterium sp.]|jgi:hypothetical protein|uniref:Imm7 family immunity protein n=1 Tax=Flavobacterium sp. TaxID=239 RepID=UPI0037C14A90